MTAVEIVSKINDKNTKNKETNVSIGYDIVVLINTGNIDGAVKYVQDYFQCDEETAKEAIKIRRMTLGSKPLTTQQKAHNQAVAREALNIPKCPTCSSTNIKKIGTTSKVMNTAVFGIFGTKRNKTFRCNNCGYEW